MLSLARAHQHPQPAKTRRCQSYHAQPLRGCAHFRQYPIGLTIQTLLNLETTLRASVAQACHIRKTPRRNPDSVYHSFSTVCLDFLEVEILIDVCS
jgi:hypothetical protein